jgi:hypothetical protein
MIFCHSFVSDVNVILRRFFTKPRLILACDKNHDVAITICLTFDVHQNIYFISLSTKCDIADDALLTLLLDVMSFLKH